MPEQKTCSGAYSTTRFQSAPGECMSAMTRENLKFCLQTWPDHKHHVSLGVDGVALTGHAALSVDAERARLILFCFVGSSRIISMTRDQHVRARCRFA